MKNKRSLHMYLLSRFFVCVWSNKLLYRQVMLWKRYCNLTFNSPLQDRGSITLTTDNVERHGQLSQSPALSDGGALLSEAKLQSIISFLDEMEKSEQERPRSVTSGSHREVVRSQIWFDPIIFLPAFSKKYRFSYVCVHVGVAVWGGADCSGSGFCYRCRSHRLYDETQTGAGRKKTHRHYATDCTGKHYIYIYTVYIMCMCLFFLSLALVIF